MANLLETANLAWTQLFPNPGDENAVSREEFIATAKSSFAYQTLLMLWREKAMEGYFEVPSYLLTEVEKEVVDNEMDISDLKILRSLPNDIWVQNVGGITCQCKYVKSTVNLSQLLCGDDSMDDAVRTYYPIGRKLVFPKGVHKTPLSIMYANNGVNVDERIEVDDAIADLVRTRLIEVYTGKIGQEDKTNNSNSTN